MVYDSFGTRIFVNEYGNEIHLKVTRTRESLDPLTCDLIRVELIGPHSTCDHTYTRQEAKALCAELFDVLEDDTSR